MIFLNWAMWIIIGYVVASALVFLWEMIAGKRLIALRDTPELRSIGLVGLGCQVFMVFVLDFCAYIGLGLTWFDDTALAACYVSYFLGVGLRALHLSCQQVDTGQNVHDENSW